MSYQTAAQEEARERAAHVWGASRDGHTRDWVELVCWAATEALEA